MFNRNDDRETLAKNYIVKAKEMFGTLIPRDSVGDIGVTECVEENGVFKITGPVGAVSPTGNQKTFKYTAEVKVDANGKCSLTALQIG
ncbi:MAG: hypothetical protein II771_03890 [Clostridia bacterium]|nr:hypothetical protein [Clostridia bacterium]